MRRMRSGISCNQLYIDVSDTQKPLIDDWITGDQGDGEQSLRWRLEDGFLLIQKSSCDHLFSSIKSRVILPRILRKKTQKGRNKNPLAILV